MAPIKNYRIKTLGYKIVHYVTLRHVIVVPPMLLVVIRLLRYFNYSMLIGEVKS